MIVFVLKRSPLLSVLTLCGGPKDHVAPNRCSVNRRRPSLSSPITCLGLFVFGFFLRLQHNRCQSFPRIIPPLTHASAHCPSSLFLEGILVRPVAGAPARRRGSLSLSSILPFLTRDATLSEFRRLLHPLSPQIYPCDPHKLEAFLLLPCFFESLSFAWSRSDGVAVCDFF